MGHGLESASMAESLRLSQAAFSGGANEGVGALMASVDWAATALGPVADWPSTLKTTISTMLHSRHPMFLWWGPELIQFYNDAYVPSFGIGKHPAAMGQRGIECWPEIWPIIGPEIDAVLSRGEASWHEDALVPIFRNGSIEQVYWTYGYSAVFDDAGKINGVLVVCTETTGRVLAAERERAARTDMERERARMNNFFMQAPAAVCSLRGESLVFDFANEQYFRLVNRRDLVGKPLLTALPELKDQGFDLLLKNVMETGEPFVGSEVPAKLDRKGDGTLDDCFLNLIYSPVRNQSGVVDGVAAFGFEVTEQVVARRKAEELTRQLQESEDQFRVLAESIPQLAWAAQPDGHIDWYNRRWYDFTDTSFEQMKGWGWKSVHDPEMLDDVIRRWSAALDAGEPFEMEFPLRRRDGVFRWHLTRAVPLRDGKGRILRWFGTNTDIDDAKQADAERTALLASEQLARRTAEVANRAKDEFLTTASHELRTPLNAILGWARLLRAGELDASGYLRGIETIERNAKAQVRLIEDILDGSRIITGNLHLEIRPLDMTALVQAALDAVRPSAQGKNISLTTTIAHSVHLTGDPERLQQVVWNLVNNAIKFTPKGGAVTVRLQCSTTEVELVVSDTGRGIGHEFLPHVFERFRQADGSTTRRHGGLGLGLALVKHLVEAHGGTVRAESEGEGRGARFIVKLPVKAMLAVLAPMDDSRPALDSSLSFSGASLNGVTVLVVDDEADARELVATVLRRNGAEVTTAANAARALTLFAENPPMVLVSDIGMPETDGYELIRRVRTLGGTVGAELPAIALTAYAREEDRRLALEAGFQTHVAKPVEPAELVRVVASMVQLVERQSSSLERESSSGRADTFLKFEKILNHQGIHEALRFLNSRTPHRFTGIYRFDGPMLRNVYLMDSEGPEVRRGEDALMSATYCSIVGQCERAFTTEDARRDDRLRSHAARDNVLSYCGILLRDEAGAPFGTLCHFDLVPCAVPVSEMPLMDAAAPLLMRAFEKA